MADDETPSIAAKVQSALRARDFDRLEPLLHPYLQWTDAQGVRHRGRKNVLRWLRNHSPASAPAGYELRDGQIYRWVES